MAKVKITPLADAIADAKALIAAGKLPTHKELAKRWHCSLARVPLVLNKVRKPKSRKTATTKPVVHHGRPASKKSSHPLLSRISVAMERVQNDLSIAAKSISAIPGLASSDVKKLVKKSQASVWSKFAGELSGAVDAVGKLASGKRKKKKAKRT